MVRTPRKPRDDRQLSLLPPDSDRHEPSGSLAGDSSSAPIGFEKLSGPHRRKAKASEGEDAGGSKRDKLTWLLDKGATWRELLAIKALLKWHSFRLAGPVGVYTRDRRLVGVVTTKGKHTHIALKGMHQ